MPILVTLLDYARTAVVFLLMMSVLVAAHEYGHYLFARICKMSVEEFAIGFGRKPLWVWMRKTFTVAASPKQIADARVDKGGELTPEEIEALSTQVETQYTVRPWPLGGFVRIAGMQPEEDGSELDVPGGFYSKPPLQRMLVLFAGPLFSVLSGVAILAGAYMIWGLREPLPIINGLDANMPAIEGGLKVGDRILSLNGRMMSSVDDISSFIRNERGAPITVVYDRGGKQTSLTLQPKVATTGPATYPRLGINDWALGPYRSVAPGEAISLASHAPLVIYSGLAAMVQRKISVEDNIGGPVAIVGATHQAVSGGAQTVVGLAASLSISLGFLNLLPVGFLDGGQMAIAFLELLRRKRLSFKFQMAFFSVGMVMILCLFVGTLLLDTKRLLPSNKPPAVTKTPDSK